MARRIGDPELIADSLHGMFFALAGPQHAARRLDIAKEVLDLARTASEDTTELQIEARVGEIVRSVRNGRCGGS